VNNEGGVPGCRKEEENDLEVYKLDSSDEDHKANLEDVKLDIKNDRASRFRIEEEVETKSRFRKPLLGNLTGAHVDIDGVVELTCTPELKV
jgi:hypothetical protein